MTTVVSHDHTLEAT
jgi:hypothetical protein